MPVLTKIMTRAAGLLLCSAVAGCDSLAPEPQETTDGTDQRTVHFTAAGDAGMEDGALAVLDKIRELGPDFNIQLGDLSYTHAPEQEFCDMVTSKLGSELPYELVAGNHESNGADGHISNFIKCLPNKLEGLEGEYGKQWYVDIPRDDPLMRLIVVSPGIDFDEDELDYSEGSKRWHWTKEAVEGAHAAAIPWTVVGMHTLCFSMGHYGCEAGHELTELLLSKKVDLVLTGHEHIYQRTHQLAIGRDCPGSMLLREMCVVDIDDSLSKGKGTVFATVGVGGKSIRPVRNRDPEKPYFATWSGSNRDPAFGTLNVTLTRSRMDVQFVAAEGYTFRDAFTIGK
ncbi:hypothetical protein QFZ60_000729 [Arthrobacter sp. B2I5]|uniref:metallophosphoesterase n=1 Tax=Arthrobacter sp. B2I5 TaxID=3042266 RepID=UPI00277FC8ED|nr:metallophosphoesterase [Arthrobacter sp. B2I5]MDQ0824556.1 hypothetical protein [Arthrobacter sp. B2I5]